MEEPQEAICQLCHRKSILISSFLGVCRDCILNNFPSSLPFIERAHQKVRANFHLPYFCTSDHSFCNQCIHQCYGGKKSYCGLIEKGKRWAGTPNKGLLEWYYDPIPTNCVASFACPERDHKGYKNLAVFYGGCNFNCLFCQNWHHHLLVEKKSPLIGVDELKKAVHSKVACVCFFGGDPIPQITHALAFAAKIKEKLRICWETNGSASHELIKKMFYLSAESGGILKFDLKAFDERIHIALTGVSNRFTYNNFAWAIEEAKKYPQVTVVASTLLVPGYITEDEVEKIAEFIADINPQIPYSLLGFAPNFYMENLPFTSVHHAEAALERCQEKGLIHAYIGNRSLLSHSY